MKAVFGYDNSPPNPCVIIRKRLTFPTLSQPGGTNHPQTRSFDCFIHAFDAGGYHALQLGLPELDALRENRMPLRLCAADRNPNPGSNECDDTPTLGHGHRFSDLGPH